LIRFDVIMEDTTILEWSYTPTDYFEIPLNISRDDYQISIKDGKIEAKLRNSLYENNTRIKDDIENLLNSRFSSTQLLTHEKYTLFFSGRYRIHPDGRKDIFIMPQSIKIKASVSSPDFVITNKDGTIYDSRKERNDKFAYIANLAEKYGSEDVLVKSLLDFYKAAVEDPENELIHLYEIRDALGLKFNNTKLACKYLSISETKWKALGRLANDEPLKQGRHRGRCYGDFRNASDSELKKAREIARELIINYLKYLEEISNRQ
jgi:hypothetical protein